jgi:hypothetical protein
MKFSFPYREEELTEFQLYLASKSPTVKKARNRNRLLLSIVYVAIGIMGMFRENNHLFALVFIALGILWYVLYPLWAGKFYARHFKKFVKNNYATRFGKEVVLDFTEDEVVIEEGGSEAAFAYTEFAEMAEIPSSFLIKLSTDMVIVIQKNASVSTDKVRDFLSQLSQKCSIPFTNNTDWKWK